MNDSHNHDRTAHIQSICILVCYLLRCGWIIVKPTITIGVFIRAKWTNSIHRTQFACTAIVCILCLQNIVTILHLVWWNFRVQRELVVIAVAIKIICYSHLVPVHEFFEITFFTISFIKLRRLNTLKFFFQCNKSITNGERSERDRGKKAPDIARFFY